MTKNKSEQYNRFIGESMRIKQFLITFLFLIFASTLAVHAGETAKDIIKNTQKKFKKLNSISVKFDYTFRWKLTGKIQKLQGAMYFKKENYVRYELGQQLNITNGETVWQYSEANQQVIIDKLKPKSRSLFMPKYFLNEYLDQFVAEIISRETIKGREFYILKMLPKDKDDFVQYMKVWIPSDTWIAERFEYTDLEGNTISYSFYQIAVDKAMDIRLFEFQVEPGMQVIDLR